MTIWYAIKNLGPILALILQKEISIERELQKMATVQDVQDIAQKVGADVITALADAQAKLAALIQNQVDPTEAAKLQEVVDSLSAADAALMTFDSQVKP